MPPKSGSKKAKSKAKGKPKAKGKGGGVLTDKKPKGKAKSKAKPKAPAPEKKISVTLVQLGTGQSPVELPEGATVTDLLVETGLSRKDGDVLVNSQAAKGDDKLPAGATVVFATKVQGGRL